MKPVPMRLNGGGAPCVEFAQKRRSPRSSWATRSGRSGGAVNVTGGGNAAPNVVKSFADLKAFASDGSARVIHIDGTLGAGWSGTSGDRLEIKSNKTIIGLRPGTQLKAAIHIKDASNVILRNIVVRGPGSNEDQAWDHINIEGSSKNIWVDHAQFWDGQDGNADVVKGADNVTCTRKMRRLASRSSAPPAAQVKADVQKYAGATLASPSACAK